MIQAEMLNTKKPLPPEFFVNPRWPLSASSDHPGVVAGGEEPQASSPSASVIGTDILSEPSFEAKG